MEEAPDAELEHLSADAGRGGCQEEVERMVGKYQQPGAHGEVYGLAGKAVRGMRKQEDEEWREYMLSVYDVKPRQVLSQVEVGGQENEIPKAPKALERVEISQKVVTGDALHTPKALSAQIVRQGGDYIFPVQENQASLYQNIPPLLAPEYPKAGFGQIVTDFQAVAKVNQGPGRLEKRILTTSERLNSYSTWPGWAQVDRRERQFQWWRRGRCYRTSCEVEFGITSGSRQKITPDRLLVFRREHGGLETGWPYKREVTFQEDATRMTLGKTGKVMASINNLVIALIQPANFQNAAQARRWFAAQLSETFALLTTPFS
jgi:DDE family transposase